MTDFAAARRTMVENQIRTYDVTDQTLLASFSSVPREAFVAGTEKATAYLDRLQRARDGKTQLIPPLVVARMIQALELNAGEHVLDVGSCGYGAAVLAGCGVSVVSLENDAAAARAALAEAGIAGVPVVEGAASTPAIAGGPFDAIVVHGAAEVEPKSLLAQLKDGGRLAIVMGTGRSGRVMIFRRLGAVTSQARALDAMAPAMAEFARPETFTF